VEQSLFNLNIERAVLNTVLSEPNLFETVASEIKPEHFYLAAHQLIFGAMIALSNERLPIDDQFIRKKLANEQPPIDDTLMEIIATSPLPSTIPYMNELTELAIKREMIALSGDIRRTIFDDQLDAAEAIDYVQKRLFEIGTDSGGKEFRNAEEIAVSTMRQIEANKARGNKLVIGLDTGFVGLNRITSGFGAGDMIVIAARPSMGKTAFMLNLASNVLNGGGGVAIFSLEMPAEHLMLRMLSAKTGVPLQMVKVGNMNDDEWGRINDAADTYAKSKLFIDDDGMLTLPRLRSRLRRLKLLRPEINLAIIDYLQLMSGTGNKDRHQEVSDISRGIKMLARELAIPIIALSQLNRALENRSDKRPILADIRESGAIEQDADIVMFVHREDVYRAIEAKEKRKRGEESSGEPFREKSEEDAEIIIAKQRNGETGTVRMIFQKAFTRFVDGAGSQSVSTHYHKGTTVNTYKNVDMPTIA
jgi:replicative DNA helicase